MLQAKLIQPQKIIFRDVEKPSPGPDELLLRIRRVGICGSDIHTYYGKHPFVSCPVVMGHEFSGEVVEAGKDVKDFKPGDRVTATPQIYCGQCTPCLEGRYNICNHLNVLGCLSDGACQEYFIAKAAKTFILPSQISFDEGAMIEPAAVGLHALSRAGNIQGKNILILGSGTIGNLLGQCAKAAGASCVIITDLSDSRLSLARQCGIDIGVNVTSENLDQILYEHFGPDKADIIFECSGSNAALSQAVSLARKGTDIIVAAVYEQEAVVNMSLVQDRELRLIGTLMYRDDDFEKAIQLVQENKIHLSPLISAHFPLSQYDKAYHYIEDAKDKSMKVIIDVS